MGRERRATNRVNSLPYAGMTGSGPKGFSQAGHDHQPPLANENMLRPGERVGKIESN